MTSYALNFGNLNISWIGDEKENYDIQNTPYTLYNGSTFVAVNPAVGRKPSFSGVFKNRSNINQVMEEVGNKRYLTLNNETRGYGAITDFNFNYMSSNSIDIYYTFSITFTLENTSTGV